MKAGRRRTAAWQGSSRVFLLSLLFAWSAPVPSVQPQESYAAPPTAGSVPYQLDATAGRWIVAPGEPGSDVPPVGRSLFDYLVTDNSGPEPVYRVPFPFTALREGLERQLRKNANGSSGIRQVLIPLGRSLQRTAAAPDFFRYPRVVLAVDGEPQAQPHESGVFMKDRLYLGYLEKPGVLEVISYNESAGRFEFQIVSDYREGGKANVVYANRAVCTACHQNLTPIFARPLWGETNADPGIAALLEAERRDYYGIPQRVGIDIPAAIDDATDRANRIPAVHLLWQQGCGADPQSPAARSCRGKVLGFALQFRLTKSLGFSNEESPEWKEFMQTFATNWRARWPHGLLLSSPDVPNRIPVPENGGVESATAATVSKAADAGEERLHQQSHIPSALEPLRPRAPLEKWDVTQAAMELVTGVASFFAQIDIERLNARLFSLAQKDAVRHAGYRGECRLTAKPVTEGAVRLSFRCGAAAVGFNLGGRLYLANGKLLRGTLDRLVVGKALPVRELTLTGEALEQTADGWRIRLGLASGALHGRLPDGDALKMLQLSWEGADPSAGPPGQIKRARVELETVEDFAILKRAISAISESGDDARDALSDMPLRRIALVGALTEELGMQEITGCCLDAVNLPPLRLDKPDKLAIDSGMDASPESVFFRRCSLCHRTNERFPPNFLAGDRDKVRANLAQCAERLYLRLSMWELPEERRTKTPMPPFQAFHQLGLEPEEWQGHPDLAALQGYAQKQLLSQTGRAPELEALVARGYENLRPCLAQAE
ncbi:MAG: hypothetical protein H6968_19505 [Chromatiaceae bacterium]|nr:hypothetical protein [Chromatiaceae bacterium]